MRRLVRRCLSATDKRIQRAIPFPMTLGGRIVFTASALVGGISTLLNFFFPGSSDPSQISAVTFVFFVFVLGLIAGADALIRRFANLS